MVDIQNRLKLNQLGEVNFNRKGQESKKNDFNLSFTGHQLKMNKEGKKEFHFYLPTNDKTATIDVILVEEKPDGSYKPVKGKDGKNVEISTSKTEKNGLASWTVDIDSVFNKEELKGKKVRLAYKFKADNQPVLDKTLTTKIGNSEYNLATMHTRPVIETPHSMYHLMPDNFNPKFASYVEAKDDQIKNPKNKVYVRNSNGVYLNIDKEKALALKEKGHKIYVEGQGEKGTAVRQHYFNKFGGTLQGIADKIPYLKDMGVSRILSTPVFGQDQISNHGYWTTNPYQITQTMGTYNDFMDINKTLFKNGMAWVADGAFVNEGWEGIHLNHLMKWGEQSPFINWFETFDYPMNNLRAGLLPEDPKAYENAVVKVINSPIKVEFDKNGEYKNTNGEANNNYDPSKPTYVQILDKRLATNEQLNSNDLVRKYDNMAPVDPKTGEPVNPTEMMTWQNGTNPVAFEVKPSEIKQKFEKDNGLVAFLRDLFNIIPGNFGDLLFGASKNQKIGLETLKKWEKSHLEIVKADKSGGTTLWVGNKDIPKLRFLVNNAKTAELAKKIGKDEVEKATSQVQDYILQVGKYWTNEVDKTLTQSVASKLGEELKNKPLTAGNILTAVNKLKEDGILPEKLNLDNDVIKNVLDGKYNLKTLESKNVVDGLMDYPLDAIEFPREICGILSSPFIKKLANNPDEINKTRYEISNDKSAMKTRDAVYKKMDNVYKNEMQKRAVSILEKLPNEIKSKLIDSNGELKDTPEAKMAYRLIAGDMAKYITVKALSNHKIKFDAEKGLDLTVGGNKNNPYEGLHKDFYATTKLISTSPELEAESLVDALKSGINKYNDQDQEFATYIEKRLENVVGKSNQNANLITLAKLCIDRSESGLEWRIDAAKDVADRDAVTEDKAQNSDLWKETIQFWTKFNDIVRDINPRAYTIGEITDQTADDEVKMIDESGFSTQSNYTYMYGAPIRYAYGQHEHEGANKGDPVSLKSLLLGETTWGDSYFGHLFGGSMDNTNFSHVFQSNHDATRSMSKLVYDFTNPLLKTEGDPHYNQEHNNIMNMRIQILDSFNNVLKNSNLSSSDKNNIKTAVEEAVNYYSNFDKEKKEINLVKGSSRDDINKRAIQDNFGAKGVGHNINDIILYLREKGKNEIADKINDLKSSVCEDFLKPGMDKYLAMYPMLVACPGNITLYQGEEFAETAMESQGKNMFLTNRNLNPWEQEGKDNLVGKFREKVTNLYALRQLPQLSALVNGATDLITKDTNSDNKLKGTEQDVSIIHRYNEDRDVIAVLNRNGIGASRADTKPQDVLFSDGIDLTVDNDLKGKNDKHDRHTLTPNNTAFKAGDEYVAIILDKEGNIKDLDRGLDIKNKNISSKYENSHTFKVVDVNGKFKLKPKNNAPFTMEGSAIYFYRKDKF